MPKDSILENPTLPEVPVSAGPLMYNEVKGVNDVDVSSKDLKGVQKEAK